MSTLTLDGVLYRKVTGPALPGDMVVRVFAKPGELPVGWSPIGPVVEGYPFGAATIVAAGHEPLAEGAIVWRRG